ncbi:MAG TPA: inositol 2-dehydrogenase [Firmicutes bacterium]|jgi:myo-inositol 2-dehydrogenase/D-chiro-inositol 1-dehydrogenase|nr:MAG: oxidoreductase [Peptococcaceae bacterium 1109]HHT73377.1 inositol 2-dehydrogenase [Bacillota bacterium]
MTKKLRVGVLGAGRIGKIHVENLCHNVPNVEVVSVADVAVDATREWAKQFNITNVTADPHEVINNPEVDAVLICSPTDTHADYIIAAAKAGKDIFCEKPIANDLEKTKEALKAVEEAGVKLQLGFNRRFDRNFRRIRELIQTGQLGDVHIVKITSRDPGPPPIEYVKVSGGIFMDMTIHDFDMARYLTGSEVEEVYAKGAVLVDPEIGKAGDFDTAVITLKFANGAIGVIDNSRKAVYGYDQRVEAFGSKGGAQAFNEKPTNVEVSTADGVCTDKPLYFFLERYMGSFAQELQDFVTAVTEDKEPPVTGIDGLEALYIAIAATESAKTGKPVKISEVR